jgi:hypothetical protein
MLEHAIRRCFASPWRGWIVIFLSLGLGLGVVWPLADHYLQSKSHAAQLRHELTESRLAASRVARLEQQLQERQANLDNLAASCVPPARLSEFRSEVFDLARETSCQIRRMNVGEPRRRPWRTGDDPLKTEPTSTPTEGVGYQLCWHGVSMAVSGKLTDVRSFLGGILTLNALLHVQQFTLQPTPGNETEALLELECTVFDLAQEKALP